MAAPELVLTQRAPPSAPFQPRLRIGLLNNMPDAALCATERQFGDLLRAAGGDTEVELVLFQLAGVARGEKARASMDGRYQGAPAIADAGLDGLIVTGAEPKTPRLDDEPYWPALTEVADWTRFAHLPTVWSCLAAHAAVLHFNGIERRLLPAKLSGVFTSVPAGDDPLIAGAARLTMPHSRLNGLDEGELIASGYETLTHSRAAGVDAFVRREGGLQLFLQGHPEYDAETLTREYLRDVGRFLRGERPAHPGVPAGYFDEATKVRLAALSQQPRPLAEYEAVVAAASPDWTWRGSAIRLYRNWLAELAPAPSQIEAGRAA
ncbi:MAG TPA: homoserine O-succinyltransferase [Caulobacteraceae bacterium]|jgi:homoserine O-succinyltransferase|nr:homoserine O-succinyltransferase [Caulobacteraceae bacterium]